MMWFKRILWSWVRDASESNLKGAVATSPDVPQPITNDRNTSIRIVKALNGTIVQFQKFNEDKRNPFDGNYEQQYYVLKDGDDLVAAIATLLMNEKLK